MHQVYFHELKFFWGQGILKDIVFSLYSFKQQHNQFFHVGRIKMIPMLKSNQILRIILKNHKYNIGSNKSFVGVSKFDVLLSTLHIQCCFISVNTFCWTHNRCSFALYHFQFSNLHPFGSCLVAIHLLFSIFDSPTSTFLDLIIKLCSLCQILIMHL